MKISRRKFLAAAPVIAGAVMSLEGVAFGQSSSKIGSDVIVGDALSQLSWNSFYQFIYTDFTFGEGANAVSLTLTGMTDSRPLAMRRKRVGENFVMKFQGPYDRPLEQGTYNVNHFNLGDFKLFITDGGRTKRRQYYIAVINRTVN